MDIEYEATFTNINKEEIRSLLIKAGAELIRKEYLQKRAVFDLPKGNEIEGGWLRVRSEGDKTTMSLKVVDGDRIENQREIQLVVDSYDKAKNFLRNIGCLERAYQENKREWWRLDDVDITIDEWPFLEPFVEIEGKSEKDVQAVSDKIGFDYNKARFCSVDVLYSEKYNLSLKVINEEMPRIVFEMETPFNT